MKFGYVRCATVEQNEERQLRMMAEQGKYKGRKPIDADPEHLAAVRKRRSAGKMTARTAMQESGLKSNTFHCKMKETGLCRRASYERGQL